MIQRVEGVLAVGEEALEPTCPPSSLICTSAAQSQMETDSVHLRHLSFHLLLISLSTPTHYEQCFW